MPSSFPRKQRARARANAGQDGYREVVTREAVTDADGNVTTPAETKVVTVEIVTGKGYWVWSSEPGTLVP